MYHSTDEETCLKSFSRPRYFYGQLLDVRHFEAEQEYFKRKLWMLNRMVSGFGVVCGLDVQVGSDGLSVVVTPGLAIDKHGREIVVPCQSKETKIDPLPATDSAQPEPEHCGGEWAHLVVCYCESKADPEPVLAGGCDTNERCSPGTVREGYELRVRDGKAPPVSVDCQIPHLIKGNAVNYRALVDWVSAPCDDCEDPCITLGNIRRPQGGGTLDANDIDISVRPVVFSLDLLWELVLALTHEAQSRRTGKS
jgi:hypothetical protein